MATSTFRVEGMTCASCVRRVEKALAAVPGVASARVNLATEEATVESAGVAAGRPGRGPGGAGLPPGAGTGAGPARRQRAPRRPARAGGLGSWRCPLMAGMVPGLHLHLPWPVQAVLAALAALGAGGGFFLRAGAPGPGRGDQHGHPHRPGRLGDPGLRPPARGWPGPPHPPFETAAGLVAFLLTGKYLEAKARHRATHSLEALLRLAPAARRAPGPGRRRGGPCATRLLRPGDRVRVKPGSAVPVDGVVTGGPRRKWRRRCSPGSRCRWPRAPATR